MNRILSLFFLSITLVASPTYAEPLHAFSVIFLFDKSYSVSLETAKKELDAINTTIRALHSDDLVGVIGFSETPFLMVPPMAKDKALHELERLSDGIYPNGPTRLLTAVNYTADVLLRAPAFRKHIFIITDGKLPDLGPSYPQMGQHLKEMGITASALVLTQEDEKNLQFLKDFSITAGGELYLWRESQGVFNNLISKDIKKEKLKVIQAKTVEKPEGVIKETPALSPIPTLEKRFEIIKDTNVMNTPSLKGEVIFSLSKGDRVLVEEQTKGWLKLRSRNGKTGYILSDDATSCSP